MSKLAGTAYHPVNDSTEKIWEGFSWPCLFCGFLWYMYKGMWGWGIIALILAFCTFGISWFLFPFFANAQYAKSLLERGYLNEAQWNERRQASKTDTLTKLAVLKSQGILNDEEFNRQKRQLLPPDPTAPTPLPSANTTKRLATSTVLLIFVGTLALFGWLSNLGKSSAPRTTPVEGSSGQRDSDDSSGGSSKPRVKPPESFRNLKWGSSPNGGLKKFSGPTSEGITMYVPLSGNAPSPMFEVPVAEELYSFANGKLYSGNAWFDGRENFERVKAALIKTYGQPSFTNEQIHFWKWTWPGSKVEVHLSYQSKFSRTTVTLLNDAF